METFPPENNLQEVSEETDEEVFRAYRDDLGLTPEDFKKKILDVGSGSARFAKWAREHGVSSEIVSVEPYRVLVEKKKGVRGDATALPFRDGSFELVISNEAIPHIFIGEQPEIVREKVRRSLEELVRVTAAGGEIRLGRVLKGEVYENQRVVANAIDTALKQLGDGYHLSIEQKNMGQDTYEYDETGKIPVKLLAHAYLIKIKR